MSGDVQPRKRKDKRRKRDDDESSHGVHITKMGNDDVHLHVHHDHGTGGHWCAKIIFFSLMAALLGLVALIIMENRGLEDLDTPLSESRFSNYFDGWVDEHRAEHEAHDVQEPSGEALDDHDEHDELEDHEEEEDEHEEEEEPLSAELEEDDATPEEDEEEVDQEDEEPEEDEEEEEGEEENNAGENITAEDDVEDDEADEEDEEEEEEVEPTVETTTEATAEYEEDEDNVDEGDADDEEAPESQEAPPSEAPEEEDDDQPEEKEEVEESVEPAAAPDDDENNDDNDEDNDDDDFESLDQDVQDEPVKVDSQKLDQDDKDNNEEKDPQEEGSSWLASLAVKFGVGVALALVSRLVLIRKSPNTTDDPPAPEAVMRRRLTIASAEDHIPDDVEELPLLDNEYSEEEIVIEEEIEVEISDIEENDEPANDSDDNVASMASYVPETFEQLSAMYKGKQEPPKDEPVEQRAEPQPAGSSDIYVEYEDGDMENYEHDDSEDDAEITDEEDEISDVDDSDLMSRLDAKYGRLPSKEYESDPDSDDPSWTRNF